jgi:hypothetical protein
MPPVAQHTSEPKPSALFVHSASITVLQPVRQQRSVMLRTRIYRRPLPLCMYMHTSSHASTHERDLDGTHTQALKPAVPENESELPNRRDAEVRAMCRCAAM